MIPVWSPMLFRYLYMSFCDYAGIYAKNLLLLMAINVYLINMHKFCFVSLGSFKS